MTTLRERDVLTSNSSTDHWNKIEQCQSNMAAIQTRMELFLAHIGRLNEFKSKMVQMHIN